jgi:hypothetical protein
MEKAWLTDLHFLVGNEWVKGQGTPARTPFDYLVDRSFALQDRYGWNVRTLSAMERIVG